MTVAIIGAACALPGAEDLDALHRNLSAGVVSIGRPGPARAVGAGQFAGLGYLDRIDLFDHEFFGISRGEAEAMDPHQRITLQLAYHAIENACHAPASLRGTNAAVLLSAPTPGYADPLTLTDPQWILGSLPSATAARIAYLLDLTGPTMVVDTACSGSLVSVALAVEKLRAGEVDIAIAGGVTVRTVLPKRDNSVREIQSPDEICRPFDASANGTVGGEGGCLVVLKRLSDAIADGDHIHATITGIKVNHNGFRATGLSAPSQQAHVDAMLAAWHGAPPSYVECHGSATALGDMVEIDGLQRAFAQAGTVGAKVAIGSVKANLGHLDHAAGIAGLAKVLAGFRHQVHYPTPHFATANSMLDPAGPLRVSVAAGPWDSTGSRRAGLSSFGLTGTNVHAVLEQAPVRDRGQDVDARQVVPQMVTVSAKSPAALIRYRQSLLDHLATTSHSLTEVAHALNRGRDDHQYRWATMASSVQELTAALRSATSAQPAPANRPVFMLFSGDEVIADEHWATLRGKYPHLPEDPGTSLFVRQFALYELARSSGVTEDRLAGSAAGNLVVRAVREGPASVAGLDMPITREINADGLRRLVEGLIRDNAVVVELGRRGVLSDEIARLAPQLPSVVLFGSEDPAVSLARLYELGATIDWERHYSGSSIPRIELPVYPFEPISCWHDGQAVSKADIEPSADAETAVARIWQHVLKVAEVTPESRYFEIGGTSIAGITVLKQISERFGVQLGLGDLLEHSSVRALAALVSSRRADDGGEWAIPLLNRDERLPLSLNQEQLWFLDQLNPSEPLYNIPNAVRLQGPLDEDALRGAFKDLVDRHEVLRSRIPHDDGTPYVLVDAPEFTLPCTDLRYLSELEREAEAQRLVDGEARAPFDLASGPLLRAALIRLADEEHMLLCTRHHIIFDGWSHEVLFRDVFEFYAARLESRRPALPEMPVQYADFAAWQRSWLAGDRLRTGMDFWRAELAGLRQPELPLDRSRPAAQSHTGDVVEFPRDRERERRLGAFCREEGVTGFATALATVDAVMYAWAGLEDVVIGSPTAGRMNPATHELIGYFNNMLPFRTRLDGETTFRDLVHRCAGVVAGVLEHEYIPFSRIVAELNPVRDLGRHPVFSVGLLYLNNPIHSPELAGLTVPDQKLTTAGIPPGTSKFDLTFVAAEVGGDLTLSYLEYSADIFESSTALRLLEIWQQVADSDPGRPLRDLRPKPGPRGRTLRELAGS